MTILKSPFCLSVEREEKMTKLTNTREDMLQKKKQEAELHKQRTAQMYDNMAKSGKCIIYLNIKLRFDNFVFLSASGWSQETGH